MSKSQRIEVDENRREIVFDNNHRLNLHNVTVFDPSGSYLRIWSDEGVTIINPDKVLYHNIKENK